MKYYDSKHSGALAEQMLDDYVAGNLGGEGGAKVYELDYYNLGITVTPEEYSAIKDADRVFISGVLATKSVDDAGTINLRAVDGWIELMEPESESYVTLYNVTIYSGLIVDKHHLDTLIPTKTSQLTNDSGFITAADLPPSGGMPTEVISLSSEITLQEGKMLEINHTTPVVDTLTLKTPSITDTTQGLLFGIRFTCGASTPQLTFGGMLGFVSSWANGELPQLEPNVTVEIIGVKVASPSTHFLLSWAIYK